jgi:uncharacterized repeat protein (TIGR03803 family)
MVCMLFLFCAAAGVIAAPAQSIFFDTLVNFNGANGADPMYVSLVQGNDGSLYGTTSSGGANGPCRGVGCGTIFKITTAGVLTTVYSFCSQPDCEDGYWPYAGLMQGNNGNFYGTTWSGGFNGDYGTVFEITPTGTLTMMYSFTGADGMRPLGALVQGRDGNFYGTTYGGGNGGNSRCEIIDGCGTVFKLTPSGTMTTLYSFCSQLNCADGDQPTGLVQGSDGDFYGTTAYGGNGGCNGYGCGTVFKITPAGTLTTIYVFCPEERHFCPNGSQPFAVLAQASDGNFYGTTIYGGNLNCNGTDDGCGTVFRIDPSGVLTSLYSFCPQPSCVDGANPYAGLVQGSDGNFYGTTHLAGAHNSGTVFKITAAGTLTTLHSFDGTDGTGPFGGLLQASNRFFYGTTGDGGTYGDGTVFRVGVVLSCATCRP